MKREITAEKQSEVSQFGPGNCVENHLRYICNKIRNKPNESKFSLFYKVMGYHGALAC